MKLFKRTSITLLILITLIWCVIIVWTSYPIKNVRITDVEIDQTMIFLGKNNVSVSEDMLNKSVHSVKCPSVIYTALDKEEFARGIFGEVYRESNDNSFTNGEITIDFKNEEVVITGTNDILDDIDIDNATSKVRKLVDGLGLSKTDMSVYAYDTDNGYEIVFVPEYKGKSIFDCKMRVVTWGKNSFRLEAVPIVFGKETKKILPVSPCSALVEFALSNTLEGSTIKEINLGYKVKDMMLYPAWEIKADNFTYYN